MKVLIKTVRKYLKIYMHFWKVGVQITTLYRTDAIMLLIGAGLVLAINMLFFGLIFNTSNTLAGWNFYEVLFLLGFFQLQWGIFKNFYGRKMEDVIEEIFTGKFDFYLLKPVSTRFVAYALPPMFKGVPTLATAAIFLIFAFINLSPEVTLLKVALLVFYSIVSQVLIFSAFQIAVAATFFTGQAETIFSVLENAWYYGRYPKEMFTGKVLTFLTYIVPLTIFASYPTGIFLNKVEFNVYNLLYPVLVAVGLFYMSNMFFKLGVKNYSSASS